MLSRRLVMLSTVVLALGAAGCGGGDDSERISPDEAGVGTDAGFDVLVDTAATPAGGVPGMGPGDATGTGATGGGSADTAAGGGR